MEINKSRGNIFLETPLEDLVGKKPCFTLGCIKFSWCRRKALVTYQITGRVKKSKIKRQRSYIAIGLRSKTRQLVRTTENDLRQPRRIVLRFLALVDVLLGTH